MNFGDRPSAALGAAVALHICARAVLCQLIVGLFIMPVAMPAHAQTPKPIKIVAFGDSLMAGFRLAPDQAFPVQLEKALKAKGRNVQVINAGVSGDTTTAALERFEWAVPKDAEAVILELGANDALRGQDPGQARRSLETIITRLKAQGADVLLAGMGAPRNWGEAYVLQFEGMFGELAAAHDLVLYPFFLDGVVLKPDLNLDDGLHPNGRGVAEIVRRIMPKVEVLIARVEARRNGR